MAYSKGGGLTIDQLNVGDEVYVRSLVRFGRARVTIIDKGHKSNAVLPPHAQLVRVESEQEGRSWVAANEVFRGEE
jgi:hypothetical protein